MKLTSHSHGFLATAILLTLTAGTVVGTVVFTKNFRGKQWKSTALVREIAAPDHVWYVDPTTGSRQFIASYDAARPIAKQFAKNSFELLIARAAPLKFLIAHSIELQRPELAKIPTATTESWLAVPEGYIADIIAGNLQKPRVLGFDPKGRLIVSQHIEKGRLVAIENDGHGAFVQKVIVDAAEEGTGHLFNVHGFVFARGRLYVASEDRIEYWTYDADAARVTGKPIKIADLPLSHDTFPGGGHKTRTLVLGSDGKLYVSIGSSCNGCLTDGTTRAVIKRMDLDGSNVETVASGLRNTVFFIEDTARRLWFGNEMGRDDLGEELPPDELNIITMGAEYGWPHCYGNRVPFPGQGNNALCSRTVSPIFSYLAHSAPLGLRIIPASFNKEWDGDLLVAFHGSIIRTESISGYSIGRLELDAAGKPGVLENNVVGGWLRSENIPIGRPVDLVFGTDGTLYISDDHAGVIHRVRKVVK